MHPEFRFDNVDVVVNRNSLRKLFNFCCGRSQQGFRLNLMLVHNSLFVERCEGNDSRLTGDFQTGWGRNFERQFTKLPSGEEESTSHHHVLEYPLGNLRCVVQFEVDACYKSEGVEETPSSANSKCFQSSAAELKARAKSGGLLKHMPQLWFGRTRWLIIGHHENGTVTEVKVTNAADRFVEWETKYQVNLRMLVATLSQLREAVRKANGINCVAIYKPNTKPKTIEVFASLVSKPPLPQEMIPAFWDCKADRIEGVELDGGA